MIIIFFWINADYSVKLGNDLAMRYTRDSVFENVLVLNPRKLLLV
jgi:hypothetical protein